MLKCQEIVGQADAYLASELTSWQRFQFNLHLMVCRHCRCYIKAFKMTEQVSQKLPVANTMPDVDISALVAMIQKDHQDINKI
ncbi:zf-HC2 domain-containing protein [Moraxellaceae bacterium AER2_44_116]|nr:zf-HC2 domain-containing protein [Moraxellaceae bacterium]TQC98460.1 zf-HC2 domain-containing protein [Moraxellaceae bacterium AER2_44_116]